MDFGKRLSETTTDTSETTEAVTEETPAQEEPTSRHYRHLQINN